MGKFVQAIKDKFGIKLQKLKSSQAMRKAMDIYISVGKKLQKERLSANELMNDQPTRLRGTIQPEHIGKLIMFFYDPKLKDTLPYYDRCPMILPFTVDSKGFTAINFHYLHPMLRVQLLDMIMESSEYQFLKNPEEAKYNKFARRQLNITYAKIQQLVATELYKPCVKRYLWGHVRSRFYLIDPDDWATLLPMPLERFEKKSANKVWQDSFNKVFKT